MLLRDQKGCHVHFHFITLLRYYMIKKAAMYIFTLLPCYVIT